MRYKKIGILLILLFLALLLFGCTSDTVVGKTSSDTLNQNNSLNQDNNLNQNNSNPIATATNESLSLGQGVVLSSGFNLVAERVAIIPDCSMDSSGKYSDCIGVYLQITNSGKDNSSLNFYSNTALLDDKGNQYDALSFGSSCPNEITNQLSNVYPGVVKKGWLCFEKPSNLSGTLRIAFPIKNDSSPLYYSVNSSDLKALPRIAELEISKLTVDNRMYAEIKGNYKVTNGGEGYLKELHFNYAVKDGNSLIAPKGPVDLFLNSLEPGEVKDSTFTLSLTSSIDNFYKSVVLTPGKNYSVDFVLSDGQVELSRTTKTIQTT